MAFLNDEQRQFSLGLVQGLPAITRSSLETTISQIGGYGPEFVEPDDSVVFLPSYINADTLRSLEVAIQQLGGIFKEQVDAVRPEATKGEPDDGGEKTEQIMPPKEIVDKLPKFEALLFRSIQDLGTFRADEAVNGIPGIKFPNPSDRNKVIALVPTLLDSIVTSFEENGFRSEWSYVDDQEQKIEFLLTGKDKVINDELVPQTLLSADMAQEIVDRRLRVVEEVLEEHQGLRRSKLALEVTRRLNRNDNGAHHNVTYAMELIDHALELGRVHAVDDLTGRKTIKLSTHPTQPLSAPEVEHSARKIEPKREEWQDVDDIILAELLEAAARIDPRHLEQGVSINKLWMDSEKLQAAVVAVERVRLVARRADASGVLSVKTVNRGSASKMIVVVNGQQRLKLKDDMSAVVALVRWSYETSKS